MRNDLVARARASILATSVGVTTAAVPEQAVLEASVATGTVPAPAVLRVQDIDPEASTEFGVPALDDEPVNLADIPTLAATARESLLSGAPVKQKFSNIDTLFPEQVGRQARVSPGAINEKTLREHFVAREGHETTVYPDPTARSEKSPGARKLTAGIGHLLTAAERKQYPEGAEIPDAVIEQWYDADTTRARRAAKEQAEDLNRPGLEYALTSVNFQLGTGWASKFPTAWSHLKSGNLEGAVQELVYTSEGSGVNSAWFKQTPIRVKDFVAAIMEEK